VFELIMPGLVPGIRVLAALRKRKTRMAVGIIRRRPFLQI
jgi:hypothetical protein